MDQTSVKELLIKNFKFLPTPGQLELFTKMETFLSKENDDERPIFLLTGYAGTGKTTFLSSLVKSLPKVGWKYVLMASTGRAAKVMAKYTKRSSQTIHRKIYRLVDSDNMFFELQKNTHEGTVFIVDEASMIGDSNDYGKNNLLKELIQFVFDSPNNKLLLIGDEAQLPPVGMSLSPALDADYLANRFYADLMVHKLTEVSRQKEDSGILANATNLRNELFEIEPKFEFDTKSFKDIYKMSGQKFEEGINYAYNKYGIENVAIICRSNKNTVEYNKFIRNRIFYYESEIENGDMLMIVKNNYTALDEGHSAGFIANGDFAEVIKIGREEEMHGFRFMKVTLKLVDYPNDAELETYIILDTLYSNTASLSQEQNKLFYESVAKDYRGVKGKRERNKAIKEDKYFSALQVKFSYAITCHKAQGGQWDAIFVDKGYVPNGEMDGDYLRWLYTGITRGIHEVFLMNF